MKPEEISAVVNGIVPVMREYIDGETKPFGDRLTALEKGAEPNPEEAIAAQMKAAAASAMSEFARGVCKAFDEADPLA